jgi:SAM-dependent methyltransferase
MTRSAPGGAAAALIAGCCVALFALAARAALEEGRRPPFVGTPPRVVEQMLSMARLGPEDTLLDLGSGDGRIVIEGAKRFGARGLGVEMDAGLVALSRAAALREGVAGRARFERGDALATDLAPATVLTLYLSPEFNERLLPRILSSMRPGSRVVSHDFALGNWAPDRVERLSVPEKNNGRGGESSVMLWIVPANAAGRWRATIGAGAAQRSLEFSLAQQFQFLEAGLHGPSDDTLPFEASLSGDRIALQMPAQGGLAAGQISARIDADAMTGTWMAAGGAGTAPFNARRIAARPDLY